MGHFSGSIHRHNDFQDVVRLKQTSVSMMDHPEILEFGMRILDLRHPACRIK
jgi:hypothetical protein